MKKLFTLLLVMFSLILTANVHAAEEDDFASLLEALNGWAIEDTVEDTQTTSTEESLFSDTSNDEVFINEETDLSALENEMVTTTNSTYSDEATVSPIIEEENLDEFDFSFEPTVSNTTDNIEVEPENNTNWYDALSNTDASNTNLSSNTGWKLTPTWANELILVLLALLMTGAIIYKRKKA